MAWFTWLKAHHGAGAHSLHRASEQKALSLIDRGNALEGTDQLNLAKQCYESALRLAPQLPRAHLNLGNILLKLGDPHSALAAYETAVRYDPDSVGAHFNIGNTHLQLGRLDAAFKSYLRASALNPNFVDAFVAMGCVQEELGQVDRACASYERALAIAPDYAEVHNNLGNALRGLGRFESAMQSYQRALELNPTLALAHTNIGNIQKDLGLLDDAETSFRKALTFNPDDLDAYSNLLFCYNYRAHRPPTQLLAEARGFGDIASKGKQRFSAWQGTRDPSRGLRIGFVSGDLREHPVGYFMESVMAALATETSGQLELHAYLTYHCNDETSNRIKAHCFCWTPVIGWSDETLAQRIHSDAIDILIDLSGHTAHNRLAMFAMKPSPVAITWLGYFATTGVEAIDYLLADPWSLLESQGESFTELIWHLPETRLCFTQPLANIAVNPLPALAGAPLTFGCFNNLTKVNDAVLAVWARVLIAVPSSRLFLKSPQLRESSVRERITACFAAKGVEGHRLIFEGLSSRSEYLASYQKIDIALDPFPFTGGTTTVEAMWMGVPVLTLAGESLLSRQGVGLLANTGLQDWIAADVDDYVNRATRHASDLVQLAALRNGLRQQLVTSPICDATRFANNFCVAMRAMWQQWCAADIA